MIFVTGVHNHPVFLAPKEVQSALNKGTAIQRHVKHKRPKNHPQLQHANLPVQYKGDTRAHSTPKIVPTVYSQLSSHPLLANHLVPEAQAMQTHLTPRIDRATFPSTNNKVALEDELPTAADDVLPISMALQKRAHVASTMGPLRGSVRVPQIPGAEWSQRCLANHSVLAPQPIGMNINHVLDIASFQSHSRADVPTSSQSNSSTHDHVPQAGHIHNIHNSNVQVVYAPEQLQPAFSFPKLEAVAALCPESEFARYVASGFNKMPFSQPQINGCANMTHSMHMVQHAEANPSTFPQHSFPPAHHTKNPTAMRNPHAQHTQHVSTPRCKKEPFKSSSMTESYFVDHEPNRDGAKDMSFEQ